LVCPAGEKELKPVTCFLSSLVAPARRALVNKRHYNSGKKFQNFQNKKYNYLAWEKLVPAAVQDIDCPAISLLN
jgi:hypothetical protein